MSMGGIFHNTVALMVVMTLIAVVHPCVGTTASQTPHLTSYPDSATARTDFTLSCTHGQAQNGTSISVIWYRNNVAIFATSSDADASAAIFHPFTTSPEYQSVSGRISVSSSLQQHNVTLTINSTLDQGSVWRCKTGQQFSNNITVDSKDSIQDTSRDEGGNILPITAVAGSIIVAIVIVVATATSVLLVRKYKQDIAESSSQMYSTMSRDPNTDNNYTEPDHGHTGKKFPTSLSVNPEESPAYYNTAPADSQYENPPASTE